MAITIGDMLGGIGAAFGGTSQQYAQGLRQREQGITEQKRAELIARQQAMYQDAGAAFQLLQQGDLDGIISLADDRLELLGTFPDADPSDTMQIRDLAVAARQGDPIALRELATSLTSATSAGYASGILQRPEVDTRVLKPGEQVFRDGEFAYGVDPEAQETFQILTPEQAQSEGLDPNRIYERNTLTNQTRVIGEGGVTTNVNLPTTEDAATTAYGRSIGEAAGKRITAAASAQQQNANLQAMAQAIAEGARTGLGQETLLNVQNFAQSLFGIPISETAGQQEVVRALMNRLALEIRNPDSGLGLPGATSDRDITFLLNAGPGLARTPQGNALLIEILVRQNQFKVDIAREQQRLIGENNGVVPPDLDTKLIDYAQRYNYLDQQLRDDINEALKLADSVGDDDDEVPLSSLLEQFDPDGGQ